MINRDLDDGYSRKGEFKVDIARFEKFDLDCSKKLPKEIKKILKKAKGQKTCAIGFITTDDFYGMYLCWDYSDEIEEYYDWENASEPSFLYQPLVDIVDASKDIDFCNPSDAKWDFALTLLAVLDKNIKSIPDKVFQKAGFQREDIIFFATMGDGDYVQEMMDASVKMFNT